MISYLDWLESQPADDETAHDLYHARYPGRFDCGFDACKREPDGIGCDADSDPNPDETPDDERDYETSSSLEPEPTPMEPPTPHTLHCIRARACGAYGFYAQLSDASVESFGVEWLMSGLRAIHATYLAEMAAVGCDEHGGFTGKVTR